MKIINFGSCNIDLVYTLDHIVNAGETTSSQKFERFAGGKGLNQSIAAARAGTEIYHAGCIGADGEFLKEILEKSGVNTKYLKKENIPNGHAVIQVDKYGENSIFLYKGSNGIISKEYIDEVLGNFSKGDMLVLQNEINNISYLINKGYENGMKIVFNPAPFNDELKKIDLNKISYLILNEIEAEELYQAEGVLDFLSDMTKKFKELKIVITLGKKGCIYTDGSQFRSQPSFEVETVDTTGAGDTFIGYFISMLAKGAENKEAARVASAASALAVSRVGAAPSIPVMSEVEEALKILRPYKNYLKKDYQYDAIMEYIENNLCDAAVEGIAKNLGYTKAYTGNLIKEILGMSFSQILQRKRCEKAAVLLKETDMSISEIIREIGYENENFFRQKFKAIYGVSPLKYKKSN